MNNASSKSFANCIRYSMIGVDFNVEHNNVSFQARCDASDLVFQIHGMRCPARCHVIGVAGGQRVTVELCGLVGLVQGGKDRERGAGPQIGAETDANRALLLHGAPDVEEAAAEEKGGSRAMRDR